MVQIYGTCESCSTGRAPRQRPSTSELLFARDALRIAIATERSGMEFYGRGVKLVKDPRGAGDLPQARHRGSASPQDARGALRRSCSSRIRSSSRGRRSCSSRARPTACSPPAPSSCAATASTISRRYRIGIRCERGSHRFFKRYGERFEDSEGKQIFLEFADEEREHLELLIREYRALVKRQRSGDRRKPSAAPKRSRDGGRNAQGPRAAPPVR